MAMETESVSESGRIYRNSSGVFCFVCAHCGSYFENVNETLEHIDSHFSDRTIVITETIGSNEICANENKTGASEDSLEFVAIRSNVR